MPADDSSVGRSREKREASKERGKEKKKQVREEERRKRESHVRGL